MYVLVYSNLVLLNTSQTIQLNQNFKLEKHTYSTEKGLLWYLKNIF